MDNQPNLNYMIQSLSMQLADANIKIAECDARVMTQNEHIKDLQKELDELRKEQIKEMDEGAEKPKKKQEKKGAE